MTDFDFAGFLDTDNQKDFALSLINLFDIIISGSDEKLINEKIKNVLNNSISKDFDGLVSVLNNFDFSSETSKISLLSIINLITPNLSVSDSLDNEWKETLLLSKKTISLKIKSISEESDLRFIAQISQWIEKDNTNAINFQKLADLFNDIEMKLIPIIIEMQQHGVPLNIDYLSSLNEDFTKKIEKLQSRANEITGNKINLSSPQQLSKILFEDFDLPKSKKTKLGYSTDSQSIVDLKNKLNDKLKANYTPSLEDSRNLQFLNLIQDYREISKLLSSYIKTLPMLVNENTKRVHTKFNQAGTTTGRLSSNDPNLQTIPKKSSLGILVRSAFEVDSANSELISADYSQIELRVLAHFSKDKNLIKAFKNGEDIHSFTAATMYECDIEKVSSDMRRIAKILNFGVLYGLSPYGISRQTNLTVQQGKEFIDMYFNRFPSISDYLNKTKIEAKNLGYVETIFGRKRYIQEIQSNNQRVQAHGERMAVNMPIQGTAAEIIKLAMINISDKLNIENMKSKMLLQIHDELIFESQKSESKQLINILTNTMTNVVQLLVPLDINIEIGENLGEMK